MDDDDKTEQTNWSLRFDLKDYGAEVLEDRFGFDLESNKSPIEPGKKSTQYVSWLKKAIQQMSGREDIWGVQCEFCGQYETAQEKIEKHGINQAPICNNCLNNDQ